MVDVDMHSILRHDFALNTILFLLVSVYDVLTGKIVSKLQGHISFLYPNTIIIIILIYNIAQISIV